MVSNSNAMFMVPGQESLLYPGLAIPRGPYLTPPPPHPHPMFPVPPLVYTSAPGAMNVGKFPNPHSVLRVAGNNKEAQEFLSRGGQVIIRMRGLPYDCTAKQVVSTRSRFRDQHQLFPPPRPTFSPTATLPAMSWTTSPASSLSRSPMVGPRATPLSSSRRKTMPTRL